MIRQLAHLAAVIVGGVAYVIADSLDPDHMARMSRHLDAYQKALELGHPCVGGPVPSLASVEPFEMYPDPEDET